MNTNALPAAIDIPSACIPMASAAISAAIKDQTNRVFSAGAIRAKRLFRGSSRIAESPRYSRSLSMRLVRLRAKGSVARRCLNSVCECLGTLDFERHVASKEAKSSGVRERGNGAHVSIPVPHIACNR